ncbi:hypothetical protein [Paraconexibacter sp.]|uniref:hypothetical protein n=1 Tax=Paraconexibacter sp. TaxID=2949640 RepID=UPI0035668BCB
MPRRPPIATARPSARAACHLRVAASLLALAACLQALAAPTARARAGWRLPVDGSVVAGFRVTPGAPFAAGQRRGIDLRGAPGAPVRAACTGTVRFAGRVPATRGSGARRGAAPTRRVGAVTVACRARPLLATHVGLATVTVRAGRVLIRGARLGRLGPSGRLRLGARLPGRPARYVDPMALLGDSPTGVPVAPVAGPAGRRGRPPHERTPPFAPAPVSQRRPAPTSPPAPLPAPAHAVRRPDRWTAVPRARPPEAATGADVPWPAWLGLALIAAAMPVTVVGARRRRARCARARGEVPA